MKEAAESPITASRELYLEALEKHIREVDCCAATLSSHTYRKQHYLCLRMPVTCQIEAEDVDAEYKRGWILDNIPSSRSQLITIEELHGAITPEVLFCLQDNDGEGERKTCICMYTK